MKTVNIDGPDYEVVEHKTLIIGDTSVTEDFHGYLLKPIEPKPEQVKAEEYWISPKHDLKANLVKWITLNGSERGYSDADPEQFRVVRPLPREVVEEELKERFTEAWGDYSGSRLTTAIAALQSMGLIEEEGA